MHRLSSPHTSLFRFLDFILLGYAGVSLFSYEINKYSFLFFGLALILARVDVFIKLQNKVLFDSENIYVGKNKIPIREIKSIDGIAMLPPWFVMITFKNPECKNVYLLVKKPFISYINPIADKGSVELMELERLLKEVDKM